MRFKIIFPLLFSLVIGQSAFSAMTLYKDGFALIKQPVNWSVEKGQSTIYYDLLTSGLMQDSPFLTLGGVTVATQKMNAGLFNFNVYLQNLLGVEVTVKFVDNKQIKGKLLEINSTQISLQLRREIISISRDKVEFISAASPSSNITAKPGLSWEIISTQEKDVFGTLIYLSRGFDWDAVYRLVLDPEKDRAEFIADAQIKNRSNLDFSKLTLQLVEGQLRSPELDEIDFLKHRALYETSVPKEKPLGDYHIYKIPASLDLNAGENITVRLYDPRRVKFVKTYLFENDERNQKQEPLAVEYQIANTKSNKLGVPLPQGKIQIYQKMDQGFIEFVGQDQIRQVPIGETATIVSGHAFDVIGKRTVLNYDRQRKSEEATISIEIKNKLKKQINVRLIEHIFGDWVIRDASADYLKKDASTINFPLTLKAGRNQTITYTYRKEWK